MPPGSFWAALAQAWAEQRRERFHITDIETVSGGDTARSYRLSTKRGDYFIKLVDCTQADSLLAEAEGLAALTKTGTVRVPQPLLQGEEQGRAYLLLEHLPIQRSVSKPAQLGQQLAALHDQTADTFGWPRDNRIGASLQRNTQSPCWASFWIEQRLQPQLALARDGESPECLICLIEQLIDAVPSLLKDHRPLPALLHGDLWGGNVGYLTDGVPVLFDPAVYYGDRETDLAMTELFGGFDADFYAAYREHAPLDEGYPLRRELYNLYHLLNHHNLFGGGYGARAGTVAAQLLAELR